MGLRIIYEARRRGRSAESIPTARIGLVSFYRSVSSWNSECGYVLSTNDWKLPEQNRRCVWNESQRAWKWDRLMPHACLIYYSKQKLPQKQDLGIQRDGMKAKLLFSLSKYTFLKMVFCCCFSFLSHKVPNIPHVCLIFPSKSTWNVSHAFLQQKQLYIFFPSISFPSSLLELHLLFLVLYLYDFYM